MILKCNCEQSYQDEQYGAGMRVHNPMLDGRYRCTVCGKERDKNEAVKAEPKAKK